MGKSLREFCAENGRDELLRQWDTEKNGGKTPDDVSSGSSAMAWWRCDKGHSFPMRIAFRTTREQGCPYCAGRRVLAGFNDLAAVAPDVAAEWHPTLNGELRPERFRQAAAGSMVAVPAGARLESARRHPHRRTAQRLPRLRRKLPQTPAHIRRHITPAITLKTFLLCSTGAGAPKLSLEQGEASATNKWETAYEFAESSCTPDRQEGRRARWAQRHDGACTSIAG